ncbi:MAG TPA: nuclear transport factor 2 family protein [Chitinophagaceae bacterium]|nr:nuclear transport factor 2 family protein [Chitinophagaceae bacterium]
MNIPTSVTELVAAQNRSDSTAFAACFTDNAIVYDEGRTYEGRAAIRQWNAGANKKYRTAMQLLDYEQEGEQGLLRARISGIFPGSPIVLNYHLTFSGGQIKSLNIRS